MKQMLISAHGLRLTIQGKKTATSRYGDRRSEYNIGEVIEFAANEPVIGPDKLLIRVDRIDVKPLTEITEQEARAIGDYGRDEAISEFRKIYESLGKVVDGYTPVSIIYYSVVENINS